MPTHEPERPHMLAEDASLFVAEEAAMTGNSISDQIAAASATAIEEQLRGIEFSLRLISDALLASLPTETQRTIRDRAVGIR